MATPKLNLPTITGNETADVPRDFNAIANAIDNKAGAADGLATLGPDGKVPSNQVNVDLQPIEQALAAHTADDAIDAHNASNISVLDTAGLFMASDVEGALKESIQKANSAFQSASDGKTAVANAVTAKGVAASPADAFPTLATKIGQINTGKKWASGTGLSSSSSVLTVTNLSFKPSFIFLVKVINGQASAYADIDGAKIEFTKNSQGVMAQGFITNSSGFTVNAGGSSQDFKWIAIE